MKKLRLDVEELSIESFATGDPAAERGTVEANAITTSANTCHLCTRYGCPQTELCM